MSTLTEWVTQIIMFLLLAMLVDLLMPNSSMKKYIKVVVGLILILIFLQPLFHLFQMDIDTMMANALNGLETDVTEENMKNSIDLKKNEIQASQHAYILEEMAVQMKNEVEEGLEKEYGVVIADIAFQFVEGKEMSFESLQAVNVTLVEKGLQTTEGEVEQVVIDVDDQPAEEELPDTGEISNFLFEQWELEKQTINIDWREG
nr:stage III sporulation protein AF [Sediminibacillus albus]